MGVACYVSFSTFLRRSPSQLPETGRALAPSRKRRKVYFSKTLNFTGRPKMKKYENSHKVARSPYTSRYEIVVKMKKERLDELYTIKKLFF